MRSLIGESEIFSLSADLVLEASGDASGGSVQSLEDCALRRASTPWTVKSIVRRGNRSSNSLVEDCWAFSEDEPGPMF